MNGEFDLTREVAEKILKRAMAPVREILEGNSIDSIDGDTIMGIPFARVQELDRDLGVLGLTLATRYSEQLEYQTALGVMSAENVRLRTAMELMIELVEKYKTENIELIRGLAKARNAHEKIKETSMKGF